MKKRIVSAVMSAVLVAGLLAGCGSKQESWKVTCPWTARRWKNTGSPHRQNCHSQTASCPDPGWT